MELHGSFSRPALHVALPVLAGQAEEVILRATAGAPQVRQGFSIFHAGNRTAGFALATGANGVEADAVDLYGRLFAAAQGLHLYRIWNYLPDINGSTDGLENYRAFCRGRSLAFERHFGRGFQFRLPAASGVGATHGPLAVAFLAGEETPQHFENPWQIPAFEYPAEYGPRPPSFSRATLAPATGGGQELFISGTAAIRGHATMAPGDLDAQLQCTLENLGRISATAGAGVDLGAQAGWRRTFKIYLRHAEDLARAQSRLARDLLQPDDTATYLRADLCRADLLVEIEGILTRAN